MLVVNFFHIMFTSYITVFLSKKKNITYCNSFKVICSRTYAMKMYLLSIEVKDVCNVYISNMVSNIDEYLIIYKMEEFDMPCMQDRPVMEIIYIN